MPRHLHPPEHPPHHAPGSIPASRVLDFVQPEKLDAWLAPLVPEASDRAFLLRCLIGEGPIHHRGANYILLALLGRALQAQGGVLPTQGGVPVPMRLPPHLADAHEEGVYPVSLPVHALRELAGGDAQQLDAMIDCLTDGPPQHALANVVMVALIEGLTAAPTPGAP
ncbi:MAG: hypothetical protein OEW36_10815 [Hylemonella sp.]|nr:hypothetical protein [Hylemonella sp.]